MHSADRKRIPRGCDKALDSFLRYRDAGISLTDTRHALSQRAAVVTADHRRMDIALAAHRDGIAQLLRDTSNDLELAFLCGFFFFQGAKRDNGQVGTGPRAKVLGGYIAS